MKSPTSLRTLYLETERNNKFEYGEIYNVYIKKVSCKIGHYSKIQTTLFFFLTEGVDLLKEQHGEIRISRLNSRERE